MVRAIALIVVAATASTLLQPSSTRTYDTWVKGRLLEPLEDSRPAHRHERVHGWTVVTRESGGESRTALDWPLDRDGRFRQEIQRFCAEGDVSFWFELQDERGGFESGFSVGLPDRANPADPNPEEFDLGDLPFPKSRSIARGRVATSSQEPIAGAHVTLAGEKPSENMDRIQTFTRADGSFDLVSSFPVHECRLRFEADGFLASNRDIPAEGEVEVGLTAAARIEGTIELGRDIRKDGLAIEVLGHARDWFADGGWGPTAPVDLEGRYRIGGLEAGDVDVRLIDDADDDGREVLRWIPHVALHPGEAASDPRLRGLSFRRGPKLVLRVVADFLEKKSPGTDADETSAEDVGVLGRLVAVDASGGATGWSRWFWKGGATVRPPTDVHRIEVRVDGCRATYIDDLVRDSTIRLRPGIPIKVVILPADLPCALQGALISSADRKRDVGRHEVSAYDTPFHGGVVGRQFVEIPPGMGDGSSEPASDDGVEPSEDPEAPPEVETGEVEAPAPEPPNPDDHPGVLYFALKDPGAFEFALMDLRSQTLIPLPRASAVIEVKESAVEQVFEIRLDDDVVRSLKRD